MTAKLPDTIPRCELEQSSQSIYCTPPTESHGPSNTSNMLKNDSLSTFRILIRNIHHPVSRISPRTRNTNHRPLPPIRIHTMKPTQPPSSPSKIPAKNKHQTPQMLQISPFASISPSDIPTIQHNLQGCSRTAAAEQFHLHVHQAAIRTLPSPRTSTPDLSSFSNHETTSSFPTITSTYHNYVKIYPHFKLHQAFSLETDITMIRLPRARARSSATREVGAMHV